MAAARYEIIRQLACGGMAEVLLARRASDEGASDLVVIKRVLPHLSQAEGFMRMFATESRIASQLQHPNIVAVVEVGEMDALPFIAMERLDGADLLRLLQQCVLRRQSLGTHVAMAVVAGAARGLGYAHRARARDGRPLKIIHRDVSPHNIFVTRDGGVKLLDFGIAKSAAQAGHTSTGQVKGKISYMSPEQIRARPLTARSDLWSLGVVLWESVAGEKLFTRDNDAATLHAILHDPIPRLGRSDAPELDDVIAQVLQRDPDRRIGTAEEVAQRLEQLLARAGQTSLSRMLAQRVGSLVPALNPELDAVKPAVTRAPEVVTFAVGPGFSHAGMHAGVHADHRGPHRKLEIAAMPIEAPAARDDDDPTLLEIAAPPPDADFDADDTIDRNHDRPLVGENTDTHTIPTPRPFAATGTMDPVRPRAVAPSTSSPSGLSSRHPTKMFTGSSPSASSPGPSPRVIVSDDLDESLTGEVLRPATAAMPVAPISLPIPRGAPPRGPFVVPGPAASPKQSVKPLPPPIADRSRTMAPPAMAKAVPSAMKTVPGVGLSEKPANHGAEASPRRAPPPQPPPVTKTPPPEAPAHAMKPPQAPTPPAPPRTPPKAPSQPAVVGSSEPGLSAMFGDLPPRASVKPSAPGAELPPMRPLSAPLAPVRPGDTFAAAEIPSTVHRRTQPLIKRRNPWLIPGALAGLCVIAGLVVGGAYFAGALRASASPAAAPGTSTSALRPAVVEAAPAVVVTVPPPPPAPVAAAAPPPPQVEAPLPAAPPVAAAAPPAPPPVAVAPPPAPVAPTPTPPTPVVARPAAPSRSQPPRVVAPRAAVAAAPRPAVVRAAPSRASSSVMPDPFAVVSSPAPTRAPRAAASPRPMPVPTQAARPVPAPTAPRRAAPTVRGNGIFTDL